MTTRRTIRVDRKLFEIIENQHDRPFSTTEIRDLYLNAIAPQKSVDRNKLRDYIYGALLRLEAHKLIIRSQGSTGRGCTFRYAGAQADKDIQTKRGPFDQPPEVRVSPPLAISDGTLRALKENLISRRVELIASIGESEEYQRLYQTFPSLQGKIQSQYHASRDKSSKLLGQLRAVETVLQELEPPQ